MILGTLRRFKSLSGYHYRMIVFTILLPALVPAIAPRIIAYFAPDLLVPLDIFYAAAFVVWSGLAVLAVASMLKRDRSEADQLAEQKLEALSSQTSRLREEHHDLGADLRQQIRGLDETMRATLKDELGVVLPPRPLSIRARLSAPTPRMSASLAVVGGSTVVRLQQWFRHALRRLWEMVYGKPDDS